MDKTLRFPVNQRTAGGIAALSLAAAYLVAIPYFLLVVDYQNAGSYAEKLALIVTHSGSMYAITLVTYVFFGLALAVLALALYDRFKVAASSVARVSAGIGLMRACLLMSSGAVFTMGMENVVGLHAMDVDGAVSAWRTIETIADGLGGAGGGSSRRAR